LRHADDAPLFVWAHKNGGGKKNQIKTMEGNMQKKCLNGKNYVAAAGEKKVALPFLCPILVQIVITTKGLTRKKRVR